MKKIIDLLRGVRLMGITPLSNKTACRHAEQHRKARRKPFSTELDRIVEERLRNVTRRQKWAHAMYSYKGEHHEQP